MIEIKPGRYVSRIYFLCADGAGFDVMGSLYRDTGEPFCLVFRFRYYDGDQSKGPFEDGDRKSWTQVTFKNTETGQDQTEDEALSLCREIFGGLAKHAELELHTLVTATDDSDKIAGLLLAQPWVHTRQVDK